MNENLENSLTESVRELKAYFESRRESLSHEKAETVDMAIDSLMESVQALEHERDRLERLAQMPAELPQNVIPIRRAGTRPAFSQVNDKRWIIKLDCLIESKYVSEVHKMAMELHSHSMRYAFLEYRDLDKETRHSLPALLKLGAITLFIPSVLDLTLKEQEVLLSLMQENSVQRPLLMVGTEQTYSELRTQPGINIEFIAMLSRAYIKLSKPFREYKDQGLIHYFLDSLSESPT